MIHVYWPSLHQADVKCRPAYTPFGDQNPYSNYPGYPYATYYPEPAPPPPPFYQPITITVTSAQEQTTVYVTDEQTFTSTITDFVTLTTETILMPETVTATEFVPDPAPTDPGQDPGPVIITVTQYDPAPTGDPNAPFDPNAPPVDPNQPPVDPNQPPPFDPNQRPPVDPNQPPVDPNQPPPVDPNQPPFDPNAPAPTPPADFTPTPIADPTEFVPGADAPLATDQPVFDPGPGSGRAPTVVIPPELQAPSTCGPNNPCAQTADYYCDPQPLCSQGQRCPGLCFPKFGGQYSQPDDVRQAAWDKAMKEGVYRVQLTVREIRTPVQRDLWVTVVGNATENAV